MCRSFATTYKDCAIAREFPFLGCRYFLRPRCVSRGGIRERVGDLARAHPRQLASDAVQCTKFHVE
jgi:hypothetical protein